MRTPTGLVSEVIRGATLLHSSLTEQGLRIRFHISLTGANVNFFMQRGDLEDREGLRPEIQAYAAFETAPHMSPFPGGEPRPIRDRD